MINLDLTRGNESPVRVELAATLVDAQNRAIAGAAPLQITVTDPLGAVRYNVFRATDGGACTLALPLAANDAPGDWKVTVKELLSNTSGTAGFAYRPAPQCGALAGVNRRALYFWADKENIYNFFRTHRQISIVAGTSEYERAAAERVAQIFKPYNVTASIMSLEEARKARPLTDEEAKTWAGTVAAGDLGADARNNPNVVGYNLPQPAILLGNAEGNPLIKRLQDAKVLPYTPSADVPGPGRGMIAWNLMTLGHDVEVIACIGNDAAGLNEAVGTLFTLAVGLDPLTPLALPATNSVTPAAKASAQ